jgi:hypothetical protein
MPVSGLCRKGQRNQSSESSTSAATADTTLDTTDMTTAMMMISKPPPNTMNMMKSSCQNPFYHIRREISTDFAEIILLFGE